MREKIFRAWDKKEKRWIHHEESGLLFLNFETTGGGVFHLHDASETGTDYYDIVEYTGLKDTNGNDIFEGDIVECDNNNWACEFELEMASFSFRIIDGIGQTWLGFAAYKRIEVIGNIFENKDLL